MTRVCLLGDGEVTLQYELLSRETAREALSTYDLNEPYANAIGLETVSLGAAVSLLNDLDWYLVRFVSEAMVLEPSVSDEEWLSRELATAIRDDEIDPADSGRFCKLYGLVEESSADGDEAKLGDGRSSDGRSGDDRREDDRSDEEATRSPPELVEPMYVTRTGDELPAYDLREVDGTVVERVTESEFGP